MRCRFGSAESVVLPVPLSPKSSEDAAGLLVGRGRAVHRENAPLRREIVRDGEDAFLHLARVFGAEDDELACPRG